LLAPLGGGAILFAPPGGGGNIPPPAFARPLFERDDDSEPSFF